MMVDSCKCVCLVDKSCYIIVRTILDALSIYGTPKLPKLVTFKSAATAVTWARFRGCPSVTLSWGAELCPKFLDAALDDHKLVMGCFHRQGYF